MKMNTKLTLNRATEIKAALWKGYAQELIAIRFRVSQTTVSRILHGKQWTAAPWPDDSRGAMPAGKVAQIQAQKTPITEPLSPSDNEDLILSYQRDVDRRELINDAIQRIGEDAESDMEAELYDRMVTTTKVQREAPAISVENNPIEYDRIPWNEVERLAPKHSAVVQANEEKNEILKVAIGIVFKNIPEEEWKSKKTLRFIRTTYEHIKETEDAGKMLL